ncbi:MAG: YgjV family protein, partial [Balneolaceae bacterium]
MEAAVWYEIIGYAASVMVAVSLMMSKIVKLRIVNMIGAALFSLYGILIGSIPVAGMNGFIVLVNVYYLYKIATEEEYFKMLKVSGDSEFLREFLNFYRDDIASSQPAFAQAESSADLHLFVLRDMVPAGVLVGRIEGDTLFTDLDYVPRPYRDFKIGRFLFDDKRDFFTQLGVQRVVADGGDDEHRAYLKRMGFEE